MPQQPRNRRSARSSGTRRSGTGRAGARQPAADSGAGRANTFDALLKRSDHEGPQWRHRPSIRQAIAAGYVSIVPLIAIVSPLTAGTEGPLGILVKFVAVVGTFWLALQATELVYHRVLRW